MLHRNTNDLNELLKSLDTITMENDNNIILAGDFNCPDIDWTNMTTKRHGNDKEIQKSLIEIRAQAGLTQIHEEPTREKDLLDLVFTSNATLTKSSTNIPGISDHAIIVTDMDTKPYHQKNIPRKSYIWRKANWQKIEEDLEHLTDQIKKIQRSKPIQTMDNIQRQFTTEHG